MKVTINWERAERVFGILLDRLEKNHVPYDANKVPQRRENLSSKIEWGSREHGLFLFCACNYMRGGIKSDQAIISMSKMYDRYPGFFMPDFFLGEHLHLKMQALRLGLRLSGLNYHSEEVSRNWAHNFRKLHRFWGGDPAAIIRGTASFDEVCRRIIRPQSGNWSELQPEGFFGYREKMVSMIIYFLMDAGLIDKFIFPAPVDIHVLRILISNQLLEFESFTEENYYVPETTAAARELTYEYCVRFDADPLRLAEAIWLLSESFCHQNPGNRTLVVGKRLARKTVLKPAPFVWDKANINKFRRTCMVCPIRSTCTHSVPSKSYYVKGILEIRGERDEPWFLFEY